MSADVVIASCSSFSERSSFESYIQLLNNTFAGNFSLAQTHCKKEICDALYGSGNSDVSGIGVAIGYVLSNCLGVIFALSTLPAVRTAVKRVLPKRSILHKSSFFSVASAYHDSATLLAFSIQIASTVMLVRADLGISTINYGNFTMQVTWTTSVLVILPLLYGAFMPGLCEVNPNTHPNSKRGRESNEESPSSLLPKEEDWSWNEAQWRANMRIHLFVVCWALSVYPFSSRMMESFGPSKICDNCAGGAISTTDWRIIEDACIGGIKEPSKSEATLITVVGICAWFYVTAFALLAMAHFGFEGVASDSWTMRLVERTSVIPAHGSDVPKRSSCSGWLLIFITPILSVLLLFSFYRLLAYQNAMADSLGNPREDSNWSFGQIVALTVFAPVLVEIWHAYRFGSFLSSSVQLVRSGEPSSMKRSQVSASS